MDKKAFFQELDEKFMSFHGLYNEYYKWFIHEFIYYSTSEGLELIYYPETETFNIRQLVDSGYNKGKVLLSTTLWEDIHNWTMVLCPTKSSYKTDRK